MLTPNEQQQLNALIALQASGTPLNAQQQNDLAVLQAKANVPAGFVAPTNYAYSNATGYGAGVVVGITYDITGAKPGKRRTRDGQSEYDVLNLANGQQVSLSALLRGAAYATADPTGWNGTASGYIRFDIAGNTDAQMQMLNGKTTIKCIGTKQIEGNFGKQTVALWQ